MDFEAEFERQARATGTDDLAASPKDGVRNHVQNFPNHVQAAGFTRDQKCTFGNKGQERAKSGGDCKSLMSSAKLRFDMFLEKKYRKAFFLFSQLSHVGIRRYVIT